MRIDEALREAAVAGVQRLDAQLLMLHVLGRGSGERAWLLANDDAPLDGTVLESFRSLCSRRIAGEPVAYLVEEREFFGLPLRVDARVLVPRPETELLVEWSLEVLQDRAAPQVVDLGTGSGAIALAIAHARRDAPVTATDASEGALQVAAANAQRLGLAVAFRAARWLDGLPGGFDLVVSNPPYIATGDPHLPALSHEPSSALVAGADGLDDLREIVRTAPGHLRAGGWLLLEHGWDQAAAVRGLLQAAGFRDVGSRRDLAGIERCSGGKWLEPG
ncbi:peptide chain release factor N(5)-glutamine methyltransferase [Ramlibacter humi]|uniref:Release factor glutamine methyltransferase n=1 Tax=Ramlibacter humi TaxID=2530451 RepID=A0A4Z0C0F6_9BURK|nr:peptide chain release factor N(5)-glutamine methyltransferase [Ramlibacter humi]TFZ04010.1 peptide chain release factor N(5)-glutamine methyltransferase [Ramlibacter humi]